jgi:hypothetical protein
MSYTLRGRLESRMAAAIVALLVAAAWTAIVHRWWPVELALVMTCVGVACDVLLYHRRLPHQPGWAALPMGALELGLVMLAAHELMLMVPLRSALVLFAVGWLAAQVLAHAVLPVARLTYAEDGGELGHGGPAAALGLAAVVAASGGLAWATQPPTVYLAAGVHRGPLVVDRTETLVGRPGAVIEGGLVIRADNVTVRDVTVVGGTNGITVEGARNVSLDGVRVRGARMDGIHVRRAQVMISGCSVGHPIGRFAQGIDISFAYDYPMSMVEGCRVDGGQEGIVADSARVELRDNAVARTTLRGITVTEMSMGSVIGNRVEDALGIGIFCADQAECLIEDNLVAGTRLDRPSADLSRRGYGVVSHSGATAFLAGNSLARNPHPLGAFAGGLFRHGTRGFQQSTVMSM